MSRILDSEKRGRLAKLERKEAEKESEQSRGAAVINFDDYRIDHHSKAPPGARVMLKVWGGARRFQEYCDNYNKFVDAVEDCVKHNDITPEEALRKLEKCRAF